MNYEIINRRKKELGLTNAQLAESTGITLSTLDKITSGANKNPKLDTLQAIASAIGCSLDDFSDAPASCEPSPEALSIARSYDSLDPHGKRVVEAVVSLEAERCGNSAPTAEELQKRAIHGANLTEKSV